MSSDPMPSPHLEIERADGPGDPWKWSIYDGEGGPLMHESEGRYPNPDAAKRAGDKVVLIIRSRSATGDGEVEGL